MKSLKASNEKLVEGLTQSQMLQRFTPKVKQLARHVASLMSYTAHLDDLVSTGLMGVVDAFQKFDAQKFTRFSTYAEIRIRGAMIDEIRNQSWIPRSVLTKAKSLEQIHGQYQQALGRRASDSEISQALGLSEAEARQFVQKAELARVLNLDDFRRFSEKDRESLMELSQMAVNDPFESADKNQVRELIEKITAHLTPRQKEVIVLVYFAGMKNIEVSQKMGLSESRVCQLHQEAMSSLRRNQDLKVLLRCLYKDRVA